MCEAYDYAALADQYDASADKLTDCIVRRRNMLPTLHGQAYGNVQAEIAELYRMRREAHDTAEQLRKLARPVSPLRTVLVTTSTCPNCETAVGRLTSAGIPFEKVLANLHPEIAVRYDVLTAPTLVHIWENRHEKIEGLSNIIKYCEEKEAEKRGKQSDSATVCEV